MSGGGAAIRMLLDAITAPVERSTLNKYLGSSSLVDTLNTLTNKAPPLRPQAMPNATLDRDRGDGVERKVIGEYFPPPHTHLAGDAIGLRGSLAATANPLSDEQTVQNGFSHDMKPITARGVMSHEYGHRWLEQNYNGPNRDRILGTNAGSFRQPPPSPPPPGDESWGGGDERRADAFSNAVQFLAATAKGGRSAQDGINLLGRYEAIQPGTGEMVRQLIHQPSYAQHPLLSAIAPPPP